MTTREFKNTNLGKGFIAMIIAFFFGIIPFVGWVIAIVAYIYAFIYLKKDCEELGISPYHVALMLLGLFGLVAYALITAKYRKNNQKYNTNRYSTDFIEIENLHKEHYSKKDDMKCNNSESSSHRVDRFIKQNNVVFHEHSKKYKKISSTSQEWLIKTIGIVAICGIIIYIFLAIYVF